MQACIEAKSENRCIQYDYAAFERMMSLFLHTAASLVQVLCTILKRVMKPPKWPVLSNHQVQVRANPAKRDHPGLCSVFKREFKKYRILF
jgi:hypothetical protein